MQFYQQINRNKAAKQKNLNKILEITKIEDKVGDDEFDVYKEND